MRINVLQKLPRVNNYLYYGIVLFLAAFQCVNASQGEKPTQQKSPSAKAESQPQPSAVISPSPSETASKEPQTANETQKSSEQKAIPFWNATLADWIQVAINAVLLMVVFWQAHTNSQVRETMQDQKQIMNDQLQAMRDELQVTRDELQVTKDAVAQSERALAASETQANAAKQSVQIAKETFYIGERPYFGITGIGLAINNNFPRVEMTFLNGGNTPAWSFEALVWIAIGDTPESAERWNLNGPAPTYSNRFFPVGQSHDFIFLHKDVRFTEEQRERISKGETHLFVDGTAHYKDMRGEKLYYNFTALWNPTLGRFSDWLV